MVIDKRKNKNLFIIIVLIGYRKFAIILVPVGKRKGNDVIASKGQISLDAVRCISPQVLYGNTTGTVGMSETCGRVCAGYGEISKPVYGSCQETEVCFQPLFQP